MAKRSSLPLSIRASSLRCGGSVPLAWLHLCSPAIRPGRSRSSRPTVRTGSRSQSIAIHSATPDSRLNLRWLNGYALISETRQVAIPAGESELRFEGVAGGHHPAERNRFGSSRRHRRAQSRRISAFAGHVARTLAWAARPLAAHVRATGAVREHEAIIRSGADGAVVLETSDGFEALRCTGHAESIVYDQVPPGLSARPTLSVRARACAASQCYRHPVLSRHRLRLAGQLRRDAVAAGRPDRPVRLADSGQWRPDRIRRCRDAGRGGPAQPRAGSASGERRATAGPRLLAVRHHQRHR